MARALLVNIGLWGGERVLLMKYSGLLGVFTPSLALLKDLSPPFFLCLLQCNHPASVCCLGMSSPFLYQELCTGCSLCRPVLLSDLPMMPSSHPSILTSIVTSSDRLFPTNLSLFISISLFFLVALITFGNYFIHLFICLSC